MLHLSWIWYTSQSHPSLVYNTVIALWWVKMIRERNLITRMHVYGKVAREFLFFFHFNYSKMNLMKENFFFSFLCSQNFGKEEKFSWNSIKMLPSLAHFGFNFSFLLIKSLNHENLLATFKTSSNIKHLFM